MKYILFILTLCLAVPVYATEICGVEVYEEGQSLPREYQIIAPLREKAKLGFFSSLISKAKKQQTSVIDRMKLEACKVGADAIVNFRCGEVYSSRGNIYGDQNGVHGSSSMKSTPHCTASAVKWK